MMITTHTPGPWRVFGDASIGGYCGISDTATLVFYTRGLSDTSRTNAHLIAAAPELLAALERILSYDDMVEGADEARSAIAKARGG